MSTILSIAEKRPEAYKRMEREKIYGNAVLIQQPDGGIDYTASFNADMFALVHDRLLEYQVTHSLPEPELLLKTYAPELYTLYYTVLQKGRPSEFSPTRHVQDKGKRFDEEEMKLVLAKADKVLAQYAAVPRAEAIGKVKTLIAGFAEAFYEALNEPLKLQGIEPAPLAVAASHRSR